MLAGIDISYVQTKTPDLSGCDFVWVKATEGNLIDPMWATHSANVLRAGKVLCAYCFGVNGLTGTAQATKFLQVVGATTKIVALDVEGATAPTPQQQRDWMTTCAAAGKRKGLYHSLSGFPLSAGQDFNWVADWGAVAPAIPWAFWQWTGTGLDRDYFNGDMAALLRLAGQEEPMLTRKAEAWKAGNAGAVRYDAIGGKALGTVPAGTPLTSIGASLDGLWRLVAVSSTGGANPQWQYVKAAQLVAVAVPATWDAEVETLLIARKPLSNTVAIPSGATQATLSFS